MKKVLLFALLGCLLIPSRPLAAYDEKRYTKQETENGIVWNVHDSNIAQNTIVLFTLVQDEYAVSGNQLQYQMECIFGEFSTGETSGNINYQLTIPSTPLEKNEIGKIYKHQFQIENGTYSTQSKSKNSYTLTLDLLASSLDDTSSNDYIKTLKDGSVLYVYNMIGEEKWAKDKASDYIKWVNKTEKTFYSTIDENTGETKATVNVEKNIQSKTKKTLKKVKSEIVKTESTLDNLLKKLPFVVIVLAGGFLLRKYIKKKRSGF